MDLTKLERIKHFKSMKVLMKPKVKYKLKLNKMKKIILDTAEEHEKFMNKQQEEENKKVLKRD